MIRIIFLSALFLSLAIGFSSCKKCYTCDFGSNDVREFCSKDFPDGTDGLKMTVEAYEEQGYKCTAK
ncbi:MAG: hypothetical protein U0T74_12725 [Chitinophagales bacterium]